MFRYLAYATAIFLATLFLLFLWKGRRNSYAVDPATLSIGKQLFSLHCASCHALADDGIGPKLGGITRLLRESTLTSFIRDPEKVILSGNERARALRQRYRLTMPGFDHMDDHSLHAILSYIDYETSRHQIAPFTLQGRESTATPITGRLVAPVKKSGLKVELEDLLHIPRLTYSSNDLGIAALRPHPSGDGRLFASDQGGILYVIDDRKAEVFLDLRSHVSNFSIGPGIATGLGSFDFHPDFLNNGLIYITHAEKFEGQPADYKVSDSVMAEVQWVLSEWKVHGVDDPVFKGTRRELLRLHAPTFGHGAQDVGFIPGLPRDHPQYGMLYWGFGDGGSNNIRKPELGHHLRSFLGTILRIDPTGTNSPNGKYGIPADNPFADTTDPHVIKEIWAYGFRNPHRFAWDRSNGFRMMATDIGESNIEELNIVEKGADYGWQQREGTFGIATTTDLKTVFELHPSDAALYRSPFLQYDHMDGHAISGGFIYEGDIEPLEKKYIFGDIVNGKLFYANIDAPLTDSSVYELTIMENGSETTLRNMSRIQRLHLRIAYDHLAKQLYVITKADGRIRRVTKAYW